MALLSLQQLYVASWIGLCCSPQSTWYEANKSVFSADIKPNFRSVPCNSKCIVFANNDLTS